MIKDIACFATICFFARIRQNNLQSFIDEHEELKRDYAREKVNTDKTDIPNIEVSKYGQEQTFKKYSDEEIMNFAKENEVIIDKHISTKSKWSGNIVYEDNSDKVQYAKL